MVLTFYFSNSMTLLTNSEHQNSHKVHTNIHQELKAIHLVKYFFTLSLFSTEFFLENVLCIFHAGKHFLIPTAILPSPSLSLSLSLSLSRQNHHNHANTLLPETSSTSSLGSQLNTIKCYQQKTFVGKYIFCRKCFLFSLAKCFSPKQMERKIKLLLQHP